MPGPAYPTNAPEGKSAQKNQWQSQGHNQNSQQFGPGDGFAEENPAENQGAQQAQTAFKHLDDGDQGHAVSGQLQAVP